MQWYVPGSAIDRSILDSNVIFKSDRMQIQRHAQKRQPRSGGEHNIEIQHLRAVHFGGPLHA